MWLKQFKAVLKEKSIALNVYRCENLKIKYLSFHILEKEQQIELWESGRKEIIKRAETGEMENIQQRKLMSKIGSLNRLINY